MAQSQAPKRIVRSNKYDDYMDADERKENKTRMMNIENYQEKYIINVMIKIIN